MRPLPGCAAAHPRGPGEACNKGGAWRRPCGSGRKPKSRIPRVAPDHGDRAGNLRAQEEQDVKPILLPANVANKPLQRGKSISEASMRKSPNKSSRWPRFTPRRTYGEVKAARDGDTASAMEAALANTVHADKAKELATAIREVAQIEAQLPELRRQAAVSAPAGEAAIRAIRDEEEACAPSKRSGTIPSAAPCGGFPFGQTREELRLQQRTQEDIHTPEGQQQAQQLQQLRQEQEKLNFAVEVWWDLLAERRPGLVPIAHECH